VAVDPDFHLLGKGQGMEARRLPEGVVDQRPRHAVIDDVVEADFGQRQPQRSRAALLRAGFAGE
jgi:hypothetical protein